MSVKETDVYPHMPIFTTVHTPHNILETCSNFTRRRNSSVTFMVTHLYGNVYTRVGIAHALADSFDLGLLGEQSSQKFVIPCLGRRNC